MVALLSFQKILTITPIPHIKSLVHIFGCVGMHQIDHHLDSEGVGCIYQLLELVGSAETRGNTEKTGNVVSERAIVWMFNDAHHL